MTSLNTCTSAQASLTCPTSPASLPSPTTSFSTSGPAAQVWSSNSPFLARSLDTHPYPLAKVTRDPASSVKTQVRGSPPCRVQGPFRFFHRLVCKTLLSLSLYSGFAFHCWWAQSLRKGSVQCHISADRGLPPLVSVSLTTCQPLRLTPSSATPHLHIKVTAGRIHPSTICAHTHTRLFPYFLICFSPRRHP